MPNGAIFLPLFYKRSQNFATRFVCLCAFFIMIMLSVLTIHWIQTYGDIIQVGPPELRPFALNVDLFEPGAISEITRLTGQGPFIELD
jgi:hypothetical protein